MSTLTHCVYELRYPDTGVPFYVGKTTINRQKIRLREHLYEATVIYKDKKRKTPKVRTILKLLETNTEPVLVVVYVTDVLEDAYSKEKELIKFYGRKNIKTGILYNLTDGGVDTINKNITSKERRHLSLSKKGAKNGMYGRKHSDETKNNQSNIAKKSYENGTRKVTAHSIEHRNKLMTDNPGGKSLQRPIYALSDDGTIIHKFESASAAARYLNKANSLICKHATHQDAKYWKIYGFYWRYEGEYDPTEAFQSGKFGNRKQITQYDANWNAIQTFSSKKKACEAIDGNYPMLTQAISSKRMYKNFYWS